MKQVKEFSDEPVVKTLPSNAGGEGSIPGQGTKIPYASQPKKPKHKQKKQYCNKVNKDFKNSPHQEKEKNEQVDFQHLAQDWNFEGQKQQQDWVPINWEWKYEKNSVDQVWVWPNRPERRARGTDGVRESGSFNCPEVSKIPTTAPVEIMGKVVYWTGKMFN